MQETSMEHCNAMTEGIFNSFGKIADWRQAHFKQLQ